MDELRKAPKRDTSQPIAPRATRQVAGQIAPRHQLSPPVASRPEAWPAGRDGSASRRANGGPAGQEACTRRLSSAPGKRPVFEQIVTDAQETFLWRCDDYPWERNVWNVHPEYEIHLVRNAGGVALIGDYIGSFEPGHLCIVGGGLPHDWVTATAPGEVIPGRDIVIQFHPDRLRRAAEVCPEIMDLDAMLTLAKRGLEFSGETRRHGAEIIENMGRVAGLRRLTLFLDLLRVLASGPDRHILASVDFSPSTDRQTLETVNTALQFMFERFRHDIRLSDLAEAMGMSEWACSRFLKNNIGNSFTDYVSMLRISSACKLLAESAMPITDVCFEVGYCNISNFNRTFLRQRGLTPSTYRRLARNRKQSAFETTNSSAAL